MKYRIRFSKEGSMRYLGHLDTMHFFQKLFRRTGLKLSYSKGFSPHLLLTFASPLSIGMTSEGEYLDIVLEEDVSPEELLEKARPQLCEGFALTACVRLRDEAKTPMALLRAASYTVRPGVISPVHAEAIFALYDDFMKCDAITVLKKSKKGEREENIRPFIYDMQLKDEGVLELFVAHGSMEHLKVELVMQALEEYAANTAPAPDDFPTPADPLRWRYHRRELYGVDPRLLKPGEKLTGQKLLPLIGLDIKEPL